MAKATKRNANDLAIDMGGAKTASRVQEHEEAPIAHAPLDQSIEAAPTLPEPALYNLTTRALLEETEDDELVNYFIGVRSDAPFDMTNLCGISFERRKGEWDADMHSWSWQKGRMVQLSPRLVEVIRYRANQIMIECEMERDDLGREFARRKRRQLDAKKSPNKVKRVKKKGPTLDRRGLKKEEWFPLSRFIIVNERADQEVTSYDQFQAEKEAWAKESREYVAEIDRLQKLADSK